MHRIALLTVLLSLPALCERAYAKADALQELATRFTLQGKVLDPTRAPIEGARVTAVSDAQIRAASTTTDTRGSFALALEPGRYMVKIAADGFSERSQAVVASASGTESLDFVLEIAGIRDTVTVSAPAGYGVPTISAATKTATLLRDVPQSVTIITQELIRDQLMMGLGDVMRYVPGVSVHQGENNRDQVIVRGNSSSADFFVDGVRDDAQYYRDLYNLDRVEALKGPNAMIFGRGGAGGVVNRVTKQAASSPIRTALVQSGMFGHRRLTADLNEPLSGTVAFRVNGMVENSESFRRSVNLERYGIAPTITVEPSRQTKITVRYEHLSDSRVADRGITSFQGKPAGVPDDTFYGDPSTSHVEATVHLASASVERRLGRLSLRNHTSYGDYDRFYQNFVPGAASVDRAHVTLTAYNNATKRRNLFNQTDLTYALSTRGIRHTLLAGAEFGRQLTDNFRNTGYFNNSVTSLAVPFTSPTISTPVTFRQSATDADNHVKALVAAVYVQDQVELSRYVQVVGGLRLERFDLTYHNNRNDDTLNRVDHLASPRLGVIVKPLSLLSLYGSYSTSHLPSSGDQFSSLTTITQQVEPETIANHEVGAKWDPWSDLSFQAAVYRLDRANTRSTDPNDPTRIVQTGRQRTNGFEAGVTGHVTSAWQIAGGYSYQDAFVASATAVAKVGARGAQVPHHTLSVWNNYQITRRVGAGLGVLRRADMFATVDNTVTLPGYTRADAAAYVSLNKQLRLQANVENLFDKRYYVNADSNTNISPGFPRTLRLGLTATF